MTLSRMQRQQLADLVERLDAQSGFDERFDTYRRAVEALGYDGVLYTFIPRLITDTKSGITPVFAVSAGHRSDFLQHYSDAGFHRSDYTIRAITSGATRPLDWWQDQAAGQLSDDETAVIRVARDDYAIRHGVSLPLRRDVSGIAGASVISGDSDGHYQRLNRHTLPALQLFTRQFHLNVSQSSEQMRRFAPFLNELTDKERAVLRFLVSGRPLKAIEDATGISYLYASRHLLRSLRRKFGGVTKDQLLYFAGLYGATEP